MNEHIADTSLIVWQSSSNLARLTGWSKVVEAVTQTRVGCKIRETEVGVGFRAKVHGKAVEVDSTCDAAGGGKKAVNMEDP